MVNTNRRFDCLYCPLNDKSESSDQWEQMDQVQRGPDELWQRLHPSQCYVVLAVVWGLFNVRHGIHVK